MLAEKAVGLVIPMNTKTLDRLLIALTVLFDVGFIAASILVAYWIRFESTTSPDGTVPSLEIYFKLIPLMAISWFGVLLTLKRYRPDDYATAAAFWSRCKAAGITLLITLGTFSLLFRHDDYSRAVMLLATALSLLSISLGRLALHRFRQAIHALGVGVTRIALICNPSTLSNNEARVARFIHSLHVNENSGSQLVGIIGDPPEVEETQTSDIVQLGRIDAVRQLVQTHQIDVLVIVSPDTTSQILHECEGLRVQINLLAEPVEFIDSGTVVRSFNGMPVIRLR